MAPPTVDLAHHLDRLWVISDTHFGHVEVIRYTGRPFRPEEQNAIMLERWREVVAPSDPVLHLGDVALDSDPDLWSELGRLPGSPRWLVLGNHDRGHRLPALIDAGFVVLPPPVFLYRDWLVECTHEPMPPDDLDSRAGGRVLNVHGHVHDKVWLAPDRRHVNVCVEHTDYRPVLLRPLLDRRLALLVGADGPG